jgi:predicted Zn-dependent peptidase
MSVDIHRLPNGLRVVVEPMPGLRSAAVGVYVTAGGRHERPEQNGIAHFLEHMAFKGTPHGPRGRSPRRSRTWAATSTPTPARR